MAGKPKAHPGDRYGYLVLIRDTGKRDRDGSVIWECKCDCGKIIERAYTTMTRSVKEHHVISCGCENPAYKNPIGRRESHNPIRKERALKAQGQYDGTLVVMINRKNMNKNNKSGVRGVHWSSKYQKWCATIMLRGKEYESRMFVDFNDAVAHRKYLEEKYFKPITEEWKETKNNVNI